MPEGYELAPVLRARGIDPTIFNRSRTASTKATDLWPSLIPNKCEVCGATEGVTRAHIIRERNDAKRLQLDYDSNKNVLLLCGTRDTYRSKDPPKSWKCHAMFDRMIMSFLHVPNDETQTQFIVIGGPHNGKVVTFSRSPHRRAIHSHFEHCRLNNSFRLAGDITVRLGTEDMKPTDQTIQNWAANVTPTDGPTKIKESKKHEEKRVDPSDPSAGKFTYKEFINFYGQKDGAATWKKAKPRIRKGHNKKKT